MNISYQPGRVEERVLVESVRVSHSLRPLIELTAHSPVLYPVGQNPGTTVCTVAQKRRQRLLYQPCYVNEHYQLARWYFQGQRQQHHTP